MMGNDRKDRVCRGIGSTEVIVRESQIRDIINQEHIGHTIRRKMIVRRSGYATVNMDGQCKTAGV